MTIPILEEISTIILPGLCFIESYVKKSLSASCISDTVVYQYKALQYKALFCPKSPKISNRPFYYKALFFEARFLISRNSDEILVISHLNCGHRQSRTFFFQWWHQQYKITHKQSGRLRLDLFCKHFLEKY